MANTPSTDEDANMWTFIALCLVVVGATGLCMGYQSLFMTDQVPWIELKRDATAALIVGGALTLLGIILLE